MLAHVDFKTIGLPGQGLPLIIDHPEGSIGPPLPLPGPTVFWRFNNASGNEPDWADSADLTAQNAPGSAVGAVLGSRTFNGTSQYFDTPAQINLDSQVTTSIAGWLYLQSKTASQTILSKANVDFNPGLPGVVFAYDILYDNVGDQIQCRVRIPDGTNAVISILPALSTAVWYCWSFKWDGVNLYGASNGLGYASVPFGSFPQAGHGVDPPVTVGASNFSPGGAQRFWLGRLDAIGIWRNRSLTNVEWGNFYNAGTGREWTGSGWQP